MSHAVETLISHTFTLYAAVLPFLLPCPYRVPKIEVIVQLALFERSNTNSYSKDQITVPHSRCPVLSNHIATLNSSMARARFTTSTDLELRHISADDDAPSVEKVLFFW